MTSPRLRRAAGSLLVAAALALGTLAWAPAPPLEAAAPLRVLGHDRVVDLPDYGARGTTAIGYRDQRYASIELPVRNTGRLPVTVVGLDPFPELLGMVEVVGDAGLPAVVEPGGTLPLTARVRFTNCEYYTERAVNRFVAASVQVERLGIAHTVEVAYPREVVLRSPTILGCPERSTDRGLRQRMRARDE